MHFSSLLCRLCFLCFFLWPTLGQTPAPTPTPNEQYRQIMRLMAERNYAQAMSECQALIERAPEYHYAYLRLVEAAKELGQMEAVQTWFESLTKRTPPHWLGYYGLALIRQESQDNVGAIEHCRQYLQQGPGNDRVMILLVNNYLRARKNREAEDLLKGMVTGQTNNPLAHHGLGYFYLRTNQPTAALTELALVIAAEPANVVALYNQATAWLNDGRYPEALASLQTCLQLLAAQPDDEYEKTVQSVIGDVLRRMGNYSAAAEALEKAVKLAQATGDLRIEEYAVAQTASLYYRQNEFAQALAAWQQALQVSAIIKKRQFKYPTYPQRYLGNIGEVHYHLGDLAAAEQAYQEALRLSLEVKDEANQSNVLNSLSTLYLEQQNFTQALALSEQALALGEKLNDRGNQVGAWQTRAAIYRQQGNYELGQQAIQKIFALLEGRVNPLWQTETLNQLGYLHLRFDEHAQAQTAFEKTLAVDPLTTSPRVLWQAHAGLAESLEKRGQLAAAREHYQQAVSVMEQVRAGLNLEEQRRNFFASKVEVYQKLVALLMKMQAADGNAPLAAEALHYAERARARGLLDLLTERRVELRANTPPALLAQQRTLREQLSAKALTRLLIPVSQADAPTTVALNKEVVVLTTALQEIETRIRSTSPRYAALTQPQPLRLPEVQQLLDADHLLLEYVLGEERSFLFVVTPTGMTTYELPKRAELEKAALQVYDLLHPRKFESVAEFKARVTPEYATAAASLGQLLLGPVAAQLGQKRLLIVADGALQYVPFAALPKPSNVSRQLPVTKGQARNNGQQTTGNRQPLILNHEIAYLPSASTLGVLRRELAGRTAAPKTIAIIADPVFDKTDVRVKAQPNAAMPATLAAQALSESSSLARAVRASRATDARGGINRLPFTRREAQAILTLVANASTKVALDFEANQTTAHHPDLSQYRYVHFATHGFVNTTHAELSGVLLSLVNAKGQEVNGFLGLSDVYNLKLPAELVTLSACQTALGKEVKGEGLVGLTRGFMYAGAARVAVSLWAVSDEATAELMTRFYRGILKDGLRPAAALRAAQLSLMKEPRWQAPYYWAAFMLQGEPR